MKKKRSHFITRKSHLFFGIGAATVSTKYLVGIWETVVFGGVMDGTVIHHHKTTNRQIAKKHIAICGKVVRAEGARPSNEEER